MCRFWVSSDSSSNTDTRLKLFFIMFYCIAKQFLAEQFFFKYNNGYPVTHTQKNKKQKHCEPEQSPLRGATAPKCEEYEGLWTQHYFLFKGYIVTTSQRQFNVTLFYGQLFAWHFICNLFPELCQHKKLSSNVLGISGRVSTTWKISGLNERGKC